MPGAATSSRRRAPLAVAVLLALASGSAAAVAAQSGESRTASSAAPAASLSGAVVDAATGEPVAGATVVLEPESAGAFPGTASGGSFLTTARTAGTDGRGRYRFEGLAPGPYQLYVMRIGYRPFSVGVDLGREPGRVSIGLEADPIALEPLRGETRGGGPYVAGDPFADDPALGRLLAAELRRRRFLTTDVRELTHADVVEGVTLGEPDVLRALQRLPGVTTRSDYTAELWTRGAPWDQTRVYFDGIPVFNPLHALGVLSGISSSAVGTVWFHPGVRSAGIAEGAAGEEFVDERPPAVDGALRLVLDAVDVVEQQELRGGVRGPAVDAALVVADRAPELFVRAELVERVRVERQVAELLGDGVPGREFVVDELVDERGLADAAAPDQRQHALVGELRALAVGPDEVVEVALVARRQVERRRAAVPPRVVGPQLVQQCVGRVVHR